MSTWEERMAARPMAIASADPGRLANEDWAKFIAGHEDHHVHLEGTSVVCSCGRFEGTTCVVLDLPTDAGAWHCELCGKEWATLVGDRVRASTFEVTE